MATKERGKILFIVLILKIMLSLKDFKKYEIVDPNEIEKISGGNCGFKVNGDWYMVVADYGASGTKDDAIGYMNFYGGSNWCCASCFWNQQ